MKTTRRKSKVAKLPKEVNIIKITKPFIEELVTVGPVPQEPNPTIPFPKSGIAVPRFCPTVDKLRTLPPNKEVTEFVVGERYMWALMASDVSHLSDSEKEDQWKADEWYADTKRQYRQQENNMMETISLDELAEAKAEMQEQIQRLISMGYTIDKWTKRGWTTRAPQMGDEVSPYREEWLRLHSEYQEGMVEEVAPELDNETHKLDDLATSQEAFDITSGLNDNDRTVTRPLSLWDIHESWELLHRGTARALENAAPGKGHWSQCFALLKQYGQIQPEVEAEVMQAIVAHARGFLKPSQLWAVTSNVRVWVTEDKKNLRNGRVSPYTVVGER